MIKKLIPPFILLFLLSSIIFFMYEINYISRDYNILGGSLFLLQHYGVFIVFASPFEFNRLLMPMAPYIFIAFSILIYAISNVLYQPIKKLLNIPEKIN